VWLEDLYDPIAYSVKGKVRYGMEIELAHNIGPVSFGCLDAQIQGHGDFFACFTLG
jgi:hypothetical protein